VNRVDYSHSECRSNRRSAGVSATVVALAAGAFFGAVALTGCGTGQLSQTASMESAVDGSQAVIDDKVALRDVHIQAQQNRDFLQPGATVDLVLVVTNQSPDVADKLVSISTDIGKVTVTGDSSLPAGGVLFVGTPNGQNRKAVDSVEAADTVKATVELSKPITNGLNYNFTFDFEKAGTTSLAVPISAGQAPPQSEPAPPVVQP
jgi:copper(I)-binding protein